MKTKSLKLKRVTITNLDQSELSQVKGGLLPTYDYATFCGPGVCTPPPKTLN